MAVLKKEHSKLGRKSEHGLYRETLLMMDRQGPVSQKQVAKEMGVTLPAAFSRFQKLDEYGLIRPLKVSNAPGRGRPVTLWDIDRDNNFSIGVCVEPPLVLMGLTDFADKMVFSEIHDLSEAKCLDDFTPILDDFVRKCFKLVNGNIRASCICMSGIVKYYEGVRFAEKNINMPFLSGFDSREYFKAKYDIECWPRTLAAALCFGETDNLPQDTLAAVIGWNLGIGILPCRNNEILFFDQKIGHTKLGMRDMGHMRARLGGRKCRCGQNGCIEAYCGGWAIIEELARPDIRRLSDLIRLAKEQDGQVLEKLNEAAEFLGEELTWMVHFMGVEKIIFTGPLSEIYNYVEDSFRKGLSKGLTKSEIDYLNPVVSSDPILNMLNGACRASTSMYLHRHEFNI